MTREEQLNKAAFDYVNQGGTTAEWGDCWEETGMCYCEYSTYELALEDALKYAL